MTRWMRGIEAPPFWAAQLQKPGSVDRWQIIHFQAPGTVNIDVGVAPAGSGAPEGDRSQGVNGFVLNTMTPETDTTCHYFWAFVRNHRITEQRLTTEIREGVSSIFREDEIILEAQQRAMDENPGPRLLQSQHRRRRDVGAARDRPHGGARDRAATPRPRSRP